MSETRGQRILKWKLNFLTSGIRIKSKNQTRWNWDTKYQFGWYLHSQALSFVAEASGFGWQGYVQGNSSFGYYLPSLWQSQCTSWLMPSSSGQYFGYSFLKQTDIWKEEARQSHSNADTTKWTTSSSIWYRFTSTETYPPLGNYTRNSIGRIERSLYSISFQKLNLFISKKSF